MFGDQDLTEEDDDSTFAKCTLEIRKKLRETVEEDRIYSAVASIEKPNHKSHPNIGKEGTKILMDQVKTLERNTGQPKDCKRVVPKALIIEILINGKPV